MVAKRQKTALITGASSGFGLLTTIALAKRGWHVLATMRDLGRRNRLEAVAAKADVLQNIEIFPLDITKTHDIENLVLSVSKRQGPLHALINNAGFSLVGFAADVADAELREQFETNFFGAVAVTRAFLPQMLRQGFGHVVMISSLSGQMAFPGLSSYVSSKFALEGWSEALRLELKASGIQVVLVEPGPFETDIWTRNAKLSAASQGETQPTSSIENRKPRFYRDRPRPAPGIVAETVANILELPNPKLRYVIGAYAKWVVLFRRFFPWSVLEKMILKDFEKEL